MSTLKGKAHALLYGPEGLRSGWRVLMWTQASSVSSVIMIIPFLAALVAWRPEELPLIVMLAFNATMVPPLVLTAWACVRFIDEGAWAQTGLGGPWWRAIWHVVLGTGIGVGMIAGLLGVFALFDVVTIDFRAVEPGALLMWLTVLFFAAGVEELIFRGYPFMWTSKGIGKVGATALFSVTFGAIHATNPNYNLIGFVSIVGAGVLLSYCYFRSEDLWFPTGVHWGWNLAQGILFGIPISGLDTDSLPTIFNTTFEGPEWLVGGAFGFEGSVMAIVAMVIGAGLAWLTVKPPSQTSSDPAQINPS